VKINHSIVELHVRKIVNGDGSIIMLLFDARNTPYFAYTVHATYDQGSMKAGLGAGLPIYFYLYLLTVSIAESVVLIYLFLVMNKRSKRKFFSRLTQEIMDVRKELKANLSSVYIPPVYIERGRWQRPVRRDRVWQRRKFGIRVWGDKRGLIHDIKDYILVDDFYSNLFLISEITQTTI
jgi:hypothetical protein